MNSFRPWLLSAACLIVTTHSRCQPAPAPVTLPPVAGLLTECPTDLDGPPLVFVDESAAPFCIDATEVTASQYQTFIDSVTPAGFEQPSDCSWNASFEPGTLEGACDGTQFDPVGAPDHPAVCVDWCDAHAYCSWAGKRLCGDSIGRALTNATYATARDAWYMACSAAAETTYPYGDEFQEGICRDASVDGVIGPVGSLAGCTGDRPPFDQIFDLAGNASEWGDYCLNNGSTPSQRPCIRRGSSATDSNINMNFSCGRSGGSISAEFIARSVSANPSVGFRCCLL